MSLRRLINIVDRFVWVVAVICMTVMFLVMTGQVLLRYLFAYSFAWAEELARFLFVWAMYMGAAAGLKKGQLATVHVVEERLPKKAQPFVFGLQVLIMPLVLAINIRYGVYLVNYTMSQRSAALLLPMGLPYIIVPLSSLIMGLYIVEIIWNRYAKAKSGTNQVDNTNTAGR